MVTKNEQRKLRSTVALLNSMVLSGEQHSEQSKKEVSEALNIINGLSVKDNKCECDVTYDQRSMMERETGICRTCGKKFSEFV